MMTKKVRIENADTSDHKLVVQVWQKGATLRSGALSAANEEPQQHSKLRSLYAATTAEPVRAVKLGGKRPKVAITSASSRSSSSAMSSVCTPL